MPNFTHFKAESVFGKPLFQSYISHMFFLNHLIKKKQKKQIILLFPYIFSNSLCLPLSNKSSEKENISSAVSSLSSVTDGLQNSAQTFLFFLWKQRL